MAITTLLFMQEYVPFLPVNHKPQAQNHGVPVYITGFVVAMAPLCLALISPLIGYFVSTHTLTYSLLITELSTSVALCLFLSHRVF